MQRSPRFTALSASPRTATTRPRRTPTSTLQPVPQKRHGAFCQRSTGGWAWASGGTRRSAPTAEATPAVTVALMNSRRSILIARASSVGERRRSAPRYRSRREVATGQTLQCRRTGRFAPGGLAGAPRGLRRGLSRRGEERGGGERVVRGPALAHERERLAGAPEQRLRLRRLAAAPAGARERGLGPADGLGGPAPLGAEPAGPLGQDQGVLRLVTRAAGLGERRARGLLRPVVAAGAGDRVGHEVRRDPRERRRRRPAVERALRAVAALAALVARAVVAARARRRRRGDGLVHLRRVAGGARRAELAHVADVGDRQAPEPHGLRLRDAGRLVAEHRAVAPAHELVVASGRRPAEQRDRLVEPAVGELEQVRGVEDVV